jgi:uncharacterized protein YjdB
MPDTVKAITVTLGQPTLTVGAVTTATASVTSDVTDSQQDQQAIIWSSSNLAVATVTASTTNVQIRAVAVGTATIRAAIGQVSGSAALTVTAPPIPVIDINAAQEAAINAVSVGGRFQLRGITMTFDVNKVSN